MGLRDSIQRAPGAAGRGRLVDVRFFDLYYATARRLVDAGGRLPLDHGGLRVTDPRRPHLVILGFDRMGRSLAVRAAQARHFVNGASVRVSVIDRDAYRLEQALLFRYPNFGRTCSLSFHPHEFESSRALDPLRTWIAHPDTLISVAVCFDRDTLAIEIGCKAAPGDDRRPAVTGFTADEVEIMARMEHARWVAERWLAGWTPDSKDSVRRRSPYLVPWGQLPEDVKDYDRKAVELIPALLRMTSK